MENQTNSDNIPMNEIDELRQQLAIFKQRLDQQEIVSDRLLRRSMNTRLSFLTKFGVIADIIGLLLMPVVFWVCDRMGVPWYFCGIVLLMLIIETAYGIFCHCQLQRLFADGNDLLTVRRGLLRFKRNERLQMLIEVPLLILWGLAFYWQQDLFGNELAGVKATSLNWFGISLFIGLIICFAIYVWEMRRMNKSIKEIDEFTNNK